MTLFIPVIILANSVQWLLGCSLLNVEWVSSEISVDNYMRQCLKVKNSNI